MSPIISRHSNKGQMATKRAYIIEEKRRVLQSFSRIVNDSPIKQSVPSKETSLGFSFAKRPSDLQPICLNTNRPNCANTTSSVVSASKAISRRVDQPLYTSQKPNFSKQIVNSKVTSPDRSLTTTGPGLGGSKPMKSTSTCSRSNSDLISSACVLKDSKTSVAIRNPFSGCARVGAKPTTSVLDHTDWSSFARADADAGAIEGTSVHTASTATTSTECNAISGSAIGCDWRSNGSGSGKGEGSANFVRRNLKSQGSYRSRQRRPKSKAQLRAESRRQESELDRRARCDGNVRVGKEMSLPQFKSNIGEAGREEETALHEASSSAWGLAALGLDPLQMSLEQLRATQKSQQQHGQRSLQSAPLVPRPKHGLGASSTSSAVASRVQRAVASIGTKRRARSARSSTRDRNGFTESDYSEHAPKCPGHAHTAALLTVKKSGANQGRRFYGCSFPAEDRCKFFMWAEDNPELIALALGKETEDATEDQDEGEVVVVEGVSKQKQKQTWRDAAVRAYGEKLRRLTVDELQAEIRQAKRVRALQTAGTSDCLKLGGCREELITRLLREARKRLGDGSGSGSLSGAVEDEDDVGNCSGEQEASPATGRRKRKRAEHNNDLSSRAVASKARTRSRGQGRGLPIDDESESARDCDSDSAVEKDSQGSDPEVDSHEGGGECETGTSDSESDRASEDEEEDGDEEWEEVSRKRTSHALSDSDADASPMCDEEPQPPPPKRSGRPRSVPSDAEPRTSTESYGSRDSLHGAANGIVDLVKKQDSVVMVVRKADEELEIELSDSDNTVESCSESDVDDSRRVIQAPVVATAQTAARAGLNVEAEPTVDHRGMNVGTEMGHILRSVFGFRDFRTGQRWAVERVLAGRNSLLVLPTGAGKSLCFLAPTVALPGLTIVVSPLIALMQDQLKKLPPELPGACFGGGMSGVDVSVLTSRLMQGFVKVLFVSPERLCTAAFRNLIKALPKTGDGGDSAVSLLCVDEAHCLSQWSFNFRPAFLRIRREIKHLKPRSVIALTATAPPHVQRDVMQHLDIPLQDGLWAAPPKRDNICLHASTVESEDRRRQILVQRLTGRDEADCEGVPSSVGLSSSRKGVGREPWCRAAQISERRRAKELAKTRRDEVVRQKRTEGLDSSIVYVWRRDEAESTAEFLKASGVSAAAYHGGLDRKDRDRAQQLFDRSKVSCMVATSAFGMGLDKGNVRQVLHLAAPKSVESYVQEVGRAGRDGGTAKCTLLLNSADFCMQCSLSQSSRLCEAQVLAVLCRLFKPRSDPTGAGTVTGTGPRGSLVRIEDQVVMDLESAAKATDISEAVLETLLSILELPPFSLIQVEGTHLDVVKGSFRHPPKDRFSRDALVQALLRQVHKPQKRASLRDDNDFESFTNSITAADGMSAATYGSGFSSFPGSDSGPLDTQSGYEKLEFSTSISALASELYSSRSVVSGCLYGLQREGLLQYSLSGPAMTVSITEPLAFADDDAFRSWLTRLSRDLFDRSRAHCAAEGRRVQDVWRMGRLIERHVGDGIASGEDDSEQECVRQFLCYYLVHLAGRDDDTLAAEAGAASETASAMQVMVQEFLEERLPLQTLRLQEGSCSASASGAETGAGCVDGGGGGELLGDSAGSSSLRSHEMAQLTNDIKMLLMDSQLAEIAQSVVGGCTGGSSDSDTSRVQPASQATKPFREAMVLYATRVLHGLPTSMLSAANWRHSPCWSTWRRLPFDELMQLVSQLADEFDETM